MTQQPQQESNPSYPVTWEELRNIYVGGLSLDKYDEIILRKTRSRQHPPAPSELAATAYQAGIECGREEGATQAREDVLEALARDWKGRYVEDAIAEIRRFPESLRSREVQE